MEQIKNFGRKFIKGFLKFILITCLLLLFFFTSIIVAIQFPSVQTKLVNKATSYLSEKIHYPIHIEGVNIQWFDEIVLEGVSVYDLRKGKMIYLNEAIVDYKIISLTNGKFNIDKVTLKNGKVHMIRYAPDGANNLTDFIDSFRELGGSSSSNKKPVPFVIPEIELVNMYFSYSDQRKPHEEEIFDHNYFSFDSIYADVSNLKIIADTFQIDVKGLHTKEVRTRLKVHELSTLFTVTKRNMTFDDLEAKIGKSTVRDFLQFNYNSIDDLSDFNEKIEVVSRLNNSKVSFNDLEKFASELKQYNEMVSISGNLKGKVIDFTATDLNFAFGKHSKITGNISFNGLPYFFETFIEFKFHNSSVHASDLKQYITSSDANNVLKKFGTINGSGTFVGFPQDFVTKGSFTTDIGKLSSDIRLDAKKENAKPEYSGNLQTHSLNLGKLVDLEDNIQLIDMDGKLEGVGFRLEDAEVKLNADIKRLGLNNYNYRNIKTNAKFSERTFNGYLSIKDSNLVFEAKGKVDFTKDKELFDIDAHLTKANLKPLHLSEIETLVKTDLDLNFTGTDIDEIVGKADFKNTYLLFNKTREIFIDSLYSFSAKNGDDRIFEIGSNLLSLKATGNFNFSPLYHDIITLYNEYELNIINNKNEIETYYSNKHLSSNEKYKLDFDLKVKNLNSLFEIYAPTLYLSQGLSVKGSFQNGNNSIIDINTHIDTLYYKDSEIYNSNIEISSSKLADSSNILAMFFVYSDLQRISGLPETQNFVFEGIWNKNNIDFTTKILQTNSSNKINLGGTCSFLENNKRILSFDYSSLDLLNKKWSIGQNNKIYFSKNEIGFKNLILSNAEQFISLNGTISDNSDKVAELKISQFNLQAINSLLPEYNLGGTLNGNILIKDLYHDLDLTGNIHVNQFSLDNFLLGDVSGTSKWDNINRKLLLNIELERDKAVSINLTGFILPATSTTSEALNLTASLDNADLEILSPLVKGIMSDLSGKVSGTLKVEGTMKDIDISGKAEVKKGKFKIDYLGTTYYFDDNIYLEENKIGFKKMKIHDEFGNSGIIDGGIAHDGFKDFLVDLSGKMNHLNVLNTTDKDNDLFYGTAFVTGDVNILGPFSDLTVSVNATSNKGTKIYIPLSITESVEKQSFITFRSRKNIENKEDEKNDVDLSGVKLDFNFEITPDAYAEIIFDKRTGDIIRGYGNGNIKMTIDTRGDFNMYGNYRISKGAYNYTLAGLISKEFTIERNSSITWTGDPYGGILDVQAHFDTKVPITPLIEDSIQKKQEAGRTHPVKVLLDIKGELMSPQIGLDIDITPTTAIATDVATTFEANIKRNEQELNRQVFSLLILGNFSPANSFSGIGGSASNVSQLLTNQLGNWLSQVDENLVIDIDLNGLDKEALNTFNLRLSYTLLDGRLRISRDGSFTNLQNNSNNQQSLSNIAGEWTIEYLLNQDGKFRLKLYNKNNQNQLMNNFSTNNFTSAGFSVLHTQSFNNLNDLLGLKKKNKGKKSSQNNNNQQINLLKPKEDEE